MRNILRFTLALAGVTAAAVLTLALAHSANAADLDGDGRSQSLTWMNDPAAHVSTSYLWISATSSNPTDHSLTITVADASGGLVVEGDGECWGPMNGALVEMKAPVSAYASGSVFTVTTTYRDASGVVTDVEPQPWTKP